MKSRLLCAWMALLILAGCAARPSGLSPSPAVSPSLPEQDRTASPGPAEPDVTLPEDSGPPASLPGSPSPSPSPSEGSAPPSPSPSPSPTPSPSASEPSPAVSPSPSETPQVTAPPVIFTGRVVPELPELTFEIQSEEEGPVYRATGIRIVNGGELHQSIDLTKYATEPEGVSCETSDMEFALLDMNYDGCRDFCVRDYATSTANHLYLTFFWDRESQLFVFSPELSALSNPEFDEAAQTVRGRIVLLPDVIESVFKYEQGALALQEETKRRLDPDGAFWHVTVSRRVAGVMSVVEEYDEPVDGTV